MRGSAALLLACGCFAPSTPAGVPCDPAAPVCPDGQACVPSAGGGGICGGAPGGTDGGGDAGSTDGTPDGASELGHVRTAAGWRARVFHDFSSRFTYVATDLVDGPETYDNQPDGMFVLRPPFAEALAVIAGRDVLELTATAYTVRDYGSHAPNTAGLPDNIRGGTFVPNLDGGGPAVLLSSSSASAGDGTFRVTPTWAISGDRNNNNTRAILWDAAGQFDELGLPEGYLGTQTGVFRRDAAAGPAILSGDTKSMHLAGLDLLLARQLATAMQLVQVTSGTHVEKVLAERGFVELADGPAPAPHHAWATFDAGQLVLVRADGTLETVAESLDGAYKWEAAAAVAPPHALAGPGPIVYLLESNRAQGLDRVIAIEAIP